MHLETRVDLQRYHASLVVSRTQTHSRLSQFDERTPVWGPPSSFTGWQGADSDMCTPLCRFYVLKIVKFRNSSFSSNKRQYSNPCMYIHQWPFCSKLTIIVDFRGFRRKKLLKIMCTNVLYIYCRSSLIIFPSFISIYT